jgi:hypothetical protein
VRGNVLLFDGNLLGLYVCVCVCVYVYVCVNGFNDCFILYILFLPPVLVLHRYEFTLSVRGSVANDPSIKLVEAAVLHAVQGAVGALMAGKLDV